MRTVDLPHEWNQLEKAGVPLEPPKYRLCPKHELLIRQGRSTLYVGATSRPYCAIKLMITNALRSKVLLIGADLNVASVSLHFTWLPDTDAVGCPVQEYSFGCDEPSIAPFSCEDVINHFIGGLTPVKRFDVLRGTLLGSGAYVDTLPARFRHGSEIDAELTLTDQFHNRHSVQLQLHVDRTPEVVASRGTRRSEPISLFSSNSARGNQKARALIAVVN